MVSPGNTVTGTGDAGKEALWGVLASALNEGRAISAGTPAKCGQGHPNAAAIIGHHNYCVLDAGEDREHGASYYITLVPGN